MIRILAAVLAAALGLVAVLAAALGLAAPAVAVEPLRIAVAPLDFADSSGEQRDQSAQHAARLAAFAARLRTDLDASGRVIAVEPACAAPCSPQTTPFQTMAEATRAAGATLLLAGRVHKLSTLIGDVRLTLIDLDGDRTLCDRRLTYRGDTDEAWAKAAEFAAEDVLAHCLD